MELANRAAVTLCGLCIALMGLHIVVDVAARAAADKVAAEQTAILSQLGEGVIATDARLTKAQCQKMAGVGHDGLARALKPVHTYFDGDTLFALGSGRHERELSLPELALLFEAGADCVTRAVMHAVLAADSVDRTADGGAAWRSYRAAFPSAYS